MKNTFGNSVCVTLFGESHGEAIGCVIDGLAPGIRIDREYINAKLNQRKPYGKISTARVEADEYSILSGVFEDYTTGTPLCIMIKNTNTKSSDYRALSDTPRPSHADYTARAKYHGFEDYRGGGHFSGRITAALVAAGAILSSALLSKGIRIGTHIKELHGVSDRDFNDFSADVDTLSAMLFPVLDGERSNRMMKEIEKAGEAGDSVGGILESTILGMPEGVGEPWFDSVESVLAHILYSVPGIKGVEFGSGFAFADMYGSEANDAFVTDGRTVSTVTNNNGGINGGITNGMPIVYRCAVKPTPSIFKPENTVSLSKGENTVLQIQGRHDPAIIHRARAVVDAVSAIAVADLLATRYGTDYLSQKESK